MEIASIRTEADYEAALAEIDSLWGALYGSPEGHRLDVLVMLVEAYEATHHPILPPGTIESILGQTDDFYLRSIPGMPESIVEGLNTPIDDCTDEVDW